MLPQVRQLAVPAVEVNIAEQQVNHVEATIMPAPAVRTVVHSGR
jgi:hypothetical protein